MKALTIALKDMTRSFRSLFALVFMFVIPLAVTGMFYFMFGNIAANDEGFRLPRTKVIIANLDQGSDQFQADASGSSLGELIAARLQGEDFASLMEVTLAPDAAAARRAVDLQQAGVGIVIPEEFSASFESSALNEIVEIELYKDPTLTIGPGIVQSVLSGFTDSFAGIKITVNLALEQAEAGKLTYAQIAPIVEAYMASAPQDDPTAALLDVRTPAPEQPKNLLLHIVSPIMGGMMIFYAFFTGANTAGTILREDEEGTLARLFTTPTTQAQILAGKLLAVGLTILVQIIVLVTASRLLFGIAWGNLGALALFTIGTVFVAGTFGLFLNSLLKNSKQGGILYGGALTVTGMVGMMDIFTGNAGASQLGIVPLFTPQGWAARSMLQIMMKGATPIEILPWAAAMLLWSAVFFTVGVWRFQKRYA